MLGFVLMQQTLSMGTYGTKGTKALSHIEGQVQTQQK